MSGGSHNYAFGYVQDMAGNLAGSACPKRRAFAAHLAKVAKAMHAIEWVDSSDWGEGREIGPIMDVIGPGDVLRESTERARTALAELQEALKAAEGERGPE